MEIDSRALELGYWTGHKDRLDRDLKNRYGTPEYAKEELVAELSSYMLSLEHGLPFHPNQSESYLKNWGNKTGEELKSSLTTGFKNASSAKNFINAPLYKERAQEVEKEVTESKDVEKIYAQFSKIIDDVENNKPIRTNRYINLGNTSQVLQLSGLPDTKISIKSDVIVKSIRDKHHILASDLKNLPQQLKNPIAVMRSRTVENTFIALTELTEKVQNQEKPVIAALHINKTNTGIEVVNIVSAYGRNPLQLNKDLENTLYFDTKKGYQFIKRLGLQLPHQLANNSNLSEANIKTEKDLSQAQNQIAAKINREALLTLKKLEIKNSKICEFLGISESNFYRYLRKHPITEEELLQIEIDFSKMGILNIKKSDSLSPAETKSEESSLINRDSKQEQPEIMDLSDLIVFIFF